MKQYLTAVGIAGAALAFGIGAQAAEKVKFGTNWVAEAEHGGFYQAVVDGTYEACGIEVEIVPGGPQVNNRALMLAGKIDFHMGGNMLFAFSAIEQNIPLKVIASFFQKEPQVIMTHPGQGFDTWESLKKATLMIGNNGYQSYYQWMIAEFGFTSEQRKPYTWNAGPFLANKKSGQQGYVTSEPFVIEKEGGFKPNIFLLADHGFDTYSTTVEVMQKTLDEKPEVVKCFIDASAIGWVNYLYGDNKAANALIQKHNPQMSMDLILYSIDKLKEFGIVDSGDSLTMGIGAMTHERHKSFFDKMVKAGVVKASVDYKKSYSLDYVNKGIGVELKKKLTGK